MNDSRIQKSNRSGSFVAKKGMSFVEAIIGIFIFSLVMLAVTTIFTSSFGGYKKAEKMAKNIENAQYAMNLMAKTLRTSRVTNFTPSAITAYNFSESACNEYVFDASGQITFKSKPDPTTLCADMSGSVAIPITAQYAYGSFSGAPSVSPVSGVSPGSMGKVTIRIRVCSEDGCLGVKNDSAVLQTTVSFRDYSTVGL